MTSIRVLSVGTDGSRESMDAADWAAREALRRGLPLRLVHADSARRIPPAPLDVDLPRRAVLDRTALQLSYNHPALEILARRRPQSPVSALLDAATDSETLVLGSRGFTGYSGFLVGSVALAVTARALRPVVLVRAGALPQDEHTADGPFRPVVVGLDVTAPVDEILSYAFEAAALRDAPLHAMHTWALPPLRGDIAGDALPGDAARRETLRRRALAGSLQAWRAKYPDVPVKERLLYGQPGHHLLKASTGASLTVIGRRAESTRLGCTAHSVVHHSTSPVAVVPHT
ncbi:universal stress protein [Streptomyces sp. VRA16 Mangrove soil]|uniref:universal stress protein n=1 Tax=Streptomyces sp. VRA16 Mangrove soil TaxID=2817434 RepID=UPI001A9FAE37|nr:universal stress protein [Streptomyces sp. VRA16 Mangrove soil]MBO1332922.1 universal stress protein [Streptomyces sp. VRA16 Mangrove soil]